MSFREGRREYRPEIHIFVTDGGKQGTYEGKENQQDQDDRSHQRQSVRFELNPNQLSIGHNVERRSGLFDLFDFFSIPSE